MAVEFQSYWIMDKNWASLLKEADLVIAPDTGAIHLANALGTSVVGLYAVANPLLTGPFKNLQNSVTNTPKLKKFESAKLRFSSPGS